MDKRQGNKYEKYNHLINWDNFELKQEKQEREKNRRKTQTFGPNNIQNSLSEDKVEGRKYTKSDKNSPTNNKNTDSTKRMSGNLNASDQLETNKKGVRFVF